MYELDIIVLHINGRIGLGGGLSSGQKWSLTMVALLHHEHNEYTNVLVV